MAVPQTLIEANKVITLAADVFFVDGTAFLLTVARRTKFVMAEHIPIRTATSLSKHLKRVLEVYGRAGFVVRTISMDGEFEKNQISNAEHRVQHDSSKGTCERGGTNDTNSEGKGSRGIGNTTL